MSELPPLSSPSRLGRLYIWIPAGLVLVALGVLASQAREMVKALYLNADTASAPVISSLMGGVGSHNAVTLGNYPWYESMWFMLATRSLPAHRVIWVAAPFVLTAAAVLIIAWCTWRTVGFASAWLVLVPLACVSHGLREIFFTPNWHGALVLHAAVLGAALVVLNLRWPGMSVVQRWGFGVALALFTAAGETDRLLLITSLVPFVGASLVLWWWSQTRLQRQMFMFSAATAMAAVIGGEVATRAMRHAGVVSSPFHIRVDFSAFAQNGKLLVNGMSYLGGGYTLAGDRGIPVVASAVLMLTACALVLLWVCVKAVSLARRTLSYDARCAARSAHIIFWSLAIACTCGVFLFTTAPSDVLSARYLTTAFVAVIVLLPIAAGSRLWSKGALTLGVAAYAVLSISQLLSDGVGVYGTGPSQALAGDVLHYVREQGATQGYAEYQDAAVIAWETRLQVHAYPVETCANTTSLCPFYLHTVASWYVPARRSRSFVITDASPALIPVTTTPSSLGSPISHASFGYLTVWIYAGDVASRLSW